MKYALNLANDGRVLSVTEEQFATDAVLVECFPDGDVYEYRYVDGEFVHDPLPANEVVAEPTVNEIINAMLGVTE